jgi:hypothetical protein
MYDCLSVSATGVAATEKDEISFFLHQWASEMLVQSPERQSGQKRWQKD